MMGISEERTLIRSLKLFLLIVAMAASVYAQTHSTTKIEEAAGGGTSVRPISPVEEVRENESWEMGPFINWGKGVGDRSDFNFLWLWQAYTPAPHIQTFTFHGATYTAPVGGGTYYGASLMPVIFRWNFLTKSKRIQPWFQGAGGLIYTTHKFPPDVLVPHGIPGATSVWNFSPQGGIGVHYFLRSRRSIDLGVNAVHISSASLGDHNPGVNASFQVQVGYTFWK
jgi:lipid A 3-O-deacylase